MENKELQNQIDDINRKLDVIITEIESQKRYRREIEDLRDDLMRLGNDVFHSAINELEEFTYSLEISDVLLLGKQLLRNVNNIKTAFEQMESARDFLADFTMMSQGFFNDVLVKLDDLDKKGYFDLLRESQRLLDTFVASVSVEDLKRLNETIPQLAGIMNKLSKPELIEKLDTAVSAFELIEKLDTAVSAFDSYSFEPGRKASVLALIKEMTQPEVRQGMLYMLGLFKNTVQQLEKGDN